MVKKIIFLVLTILLVSCVPNNISRNAKSNDKDFDQIHKHEMEMAPNSTVKNTENFKEDTSNVESAMVNYGPAAGFFAYPKKEGKYPAVVMMHEWWGLNDNIKEMAKQLAAHDYAVLAVDLYNGKVAATTDEASRLMSAATKDPKANIDNMKAAVDFLKKQKNVDPNRIATMGWCFGGGMSLQLSLNENVNATVIYYGSLVTDEQKLKSIKWPVLGFFGEKDQAIPVQSAKDFNKALDDLKIKNNINIYPNVGHAFANPTGANYAPNETKEAWAKTLKFLDKNLK